LRQQFGELGARLRLDQGIVLVGGRLVDVARLRDVAVAQSDDYFSVTLQDDTPRGVVRVALVFDTESKDLKQWTLTEPSGNELTFSLYDVEFNVEIPKAYFYIDPTFRAVNAPADT
jgi:outer membrane lipoprotein-sorting protein